MSVTVLDHPIINSRLATLRNKETPMAQFRRGLKDISALMAYPVTAAIEQQMISVETPLETCSVKVIKQPPIIVPVLRAGNIMSEVLGDMMPECRIAYIGVARDHVTKEPIEYLCKLPEIHCDTPVIVCDPMLATAGSMCFAIQRVKEHGAKNITLMVLLAAPEGIERLHKEHPDVKIITAALDRCLDSNAYIRPGLGDAGDRLYGA